MARKVGWALWEKVTVAALGVVILVEIAMLVLVSAAAQAQDAFAAGDRAWVLFGCGTLEGAHELVEVFEEAVRDGVPTALSTWGARRTGSECWVNTLNGELGSHPVLLKERAFGPARSPRAGVVYEIWRVHDEGSQQPDGFAVLAYPGAGV